MKLEIVLQRDADPRVFDAETQAEVTRRVVSITIYPLRRTSAELHVLDADGKPEWLPGCGPAIEVADVVRISAAGTWTAAE